MNIIKPLAFTVSLFALIPTAYASDHMDGCYKYMAAGNFIAGSPLCTKAAEQGYSDAQAFLGLIYYSGEGMPQDYKQAINWLTKAAEQGKAKAQYNLGLMYAQGTGVIRDYVEAYAWWNIAAAQGNESAVNNRGILEKQMTTEQIAKAQELSNTYYKKYAK